MSLRRLGNQLIECALQCLLLDGNQPGALTHHFWHTTDCRANARQSGNKRLQVGQAERFRSGGADIHICGSKIRPDILNNSEMDAITQAGCISHALEVLRIAPTQEL